jgi:uncharacterized membrane protein YozB (DUF420 family)
VLTGPNVILALKVAVVVVTLLLVASLVALSRGQVRLHGRINLAFFALTMVALLVFEVLIRFVDRRLFDYIYSNPELLRTLRTHLCFAIPSAILMPIMLFTGLTRRRTLHLIFAVIFGLLWTATFITGVFFLPHTEGVQP